MLAERTRDGVKSTTAGRPLDAVFKQCIESSEVLTLLQHKPAAVVDKRDTSDYESPKKRPRLENGEKGKGKGKKGGKNSQPFVKMPYDLLNAGCVASTPKGHRICFSYNLKKCEAKGQKCDKGLHVCAVKSCFKSHAALDCPSKSS